MTTPPTTVPPGPTDPYAAAQEDINLEEADVRGLLLVLEDTAHTVAQAFPRPVDAGLFGGGDLPERMGRHTAGAQERVMRTLLRSVQALHEHADSLTVYREELQRVEDTIEGYLEQIHGRATATSTPTTQGGR